MKYEPDIAAKDFLNWAFSEHNFQFQKCVTAKQGSQHHIMGISLVQFRTLL